MRDPIEVNYIPDGDDWQVTVVGRGQQLSGRAPGLIAARDQADQLVEKIAPNEEHRTVVHLLEGDAVQFTTAYLTARLAKPEAPAPAGPNADAKPVKPVKSDAEPAERPGAAPKATAQPTSVQQSAQQAAVRPVAAPKPTPHPRSEAPANTANTAVNDTANGSGNGTDNGTPEAADTARPAAAANHK